MGKWYCPFTCQKSGSVGSTSAALGLVFYFLVPEHLRHLQERYCPDQGKDVTSHCIVAWSGLKVRLMRRP